MTTTNMGLLTPKESDKIKMIHKIWISFSKHIIRANYDMIDVNATVHVSKVLQKRRKSSKNIYIHTHTGTGKRKKSMIQAKKV